MKRLTRDTLYTEGNSLETRVAALERRIIPGMVAWAHLSMGTTPQNVPSTGTHSIEWENFATDAPGLFGTLASGTSLPFNDMPGDVNLKVAHSGYAFAALGFVQFEAATPAYEHGCFIETSLIDGRTQAWYSNPSYGPATPAATFNFIANDQAGVFDTLLGISTPFSSGTAGPIFKLTAQNEDSVDRDVTFASLTVYAWPIGDDENTDPRVYGSGI